MNVDRMSNDETAMHRRTVNTEEMAVRGRATVTSETGDSWTVFRSDGDEVANTSGAVVDTVVVRAIVEHQRHYMPVLEDAASTAASA